jgi:hypothetical protein
MKFCNLRTWLPSFVVPPSLVVGYYTITERGVLDKRFRMNAETPNSA